VSRTTSSMSTLPRSSRLLALSLGTACHSDYKKAAVLTQHIQSEKSLGALAPCMCVRTYVRVRVRPGVHAGVKVRAGGGSSTAGGEEIVLSELTTSLRRQSHQSF